MKTFASALAFVVGLAVVRSPAFADPLGAPAQPDLVLPVGMSVSVGGGVAAFAQPDVRDAAGTAGSWDARFAIGTRERVALEAAYLGSAQTVDALGLDTDAVLIGQGLEASVRLNLLQRDWQPYLVAGAAWRHYDIANAAENTSDISGSDDVFELPVGVGVSWRYQGLVVDGRATFRAAFDDELLQTRSTAQQTNDDLHTFGGSVTVGWEF